MNMNEILSSAILDIQEAVMEHPFILRLQDGTLPMSNFKYYVVQDTLYLREYSRILELISGRMSSSERSTFFKEQSEAVREVEMGHLHMEFLERMEVDIDREEMSPTTTAYTDHLYRQVAFGTLEEAIISVIPCYIIYRDVASRLKAKQDGPEEYRMWIQEYSSEVFRKSVEGICRIFHEIHGSEKLSREEADVLRKSASYEYRFWQAAMTLEKFEFQL